MEKVFESFRRGFESGRMGHSYIVAGSPRGEGGRFTEKALQLLFCESGGKPCGKCRPCREVAERTQPDILWVEPQKKSRKIGVDEIRLMKGRMMQTSFAGGWKACVLVGADRMSKEASNTVLKILEAPPARTIFLLITENPQFLLPTITSRCQRLSVASEEVMLPDEWRKQLLAILETDISGDVIAMARGSMIAGFLKGVKKVAEEEISAESEDSQIDDDDKIVDARINALYREYRMHVLRFLMLWYRDIFILTYGGDRGMICNAGQIGLLEEKALKAGRKGALKNIMTVEGFARQLESNMPEELVFGVGAGNLCV